MKNILLMAMATLSISACSSIETNKDLTPKIGMANPASTYCVEQGGKLSIEKESNGEVGYCHLANGQKVEEWAYFRQSQAQCLPEEASKLVGKSELTDEQIKQMTHSEKIRRIGPNQAVTMDYRVERITLTIDPTSKKITQASCG